jgi:hypothetical protein
MRAYVLWYLSWIWWWAKGQFRELWEAMPGPWWVKAVIVGACLAIPGPQDEILLILVLKACKVMRARRDGRYLP